MFQSAAEPDIPRHGLGRARQLSQHPHRLPAARRTAGLARRPVRGIAGRDLFVRQRNCSTPSGCRTWRTPSGPAAACRTSPPPTGRFTRTTSSGPAAASSSPTCCASSMPTPKPSRAITTAPRNGWITWPVSSQNGLISRDAYGDWCVPPEDPTLIHSQDPKRETDKTLLATAYLLPRPVPDGAVTRGCWGRPLTPRQFQALAGRTEGRVQPEILSTRKLGQYDNGSQTSCVLPLAFGLVPRRLARADFPASGGQD